MWPWAGSFSRHSQLGSRSCGVSKFGIKALPGRSDIGSSLWARRSTPSSLFEIAVCGSGRRPAPIDRDHLASHVIAVVRREERRSPGNVLGIGHAFDDEVVFDNIFVSLTFAFLEADIDKILIE